MNENDPQLQDPQAQDQQAQDDMSDASPTAAAAAVRARRRRRGLLIGGVTVVALGIGAGGVGVGTALAAVRSDTGFSASQQAGRPIGGLTDGSREGEGSYGTFGGRAGGTTTVNASAATDAQEVGVVTIVSTLDFDADSQAAGTGIVLTSSGEILTNNHVIEGSTSIEVTVESTGETYAAKVVGTDGTDDIAVLQLVDGSGDKVTGLTKATLDTDPLAEGDAVTSIGNAEGTGDLVAASGTVTALNQSIQVANDETGANENLSGLIETDADVVSGDSGGPLIDSEGEVAGVVTAASSGTQDVTGYAIPIDTAISIAKQIIAGEASDAVVIGLPAFLGVELATVQTGTGVQVSGTVSGSAAAGTGLAEGDTITAVDGTVVNSADSLSAIIKSHAVGDSVTVTYADASGASQQVTVTLTEGPAA